MCGGKKELGELWYKLDDNFILLISQNNKYLLYIH